MALKSKKSMLESSDTQNKSKYEKRKAAVEKKAQLGNQEVRQRLADYLKVNEAQLFKPLAMT